MIRDDRSRGEVFHVRPSDVLEPVGLTRWLRVGQMAFSVNIKSVGY